MKTNKKNSKIPPKLNKNTKNPSENSKVKGKSQLHGISETNESSQIALKAPDVTQVVKRSYKLSIFLMESTDYWFAFFFAESALDGHASRVQEASVAKLTGAASGRTKIRRVGYQTPTPRLGIPGPLGNSKEPARSWFLGRLEKSWKILTVIVLAPYW